MKVMRPRLFSGIEAEGRYKGLRTLFVQGSVPAPLIFRHLDYDYQQVYFGAGGVSNVDWKTVDYVCRQQTIPIAVETDAVFDEFYFREHENLHLIIPLTMPIAESTFMVEWAAQTLDTNRVQVKFDSLDRTYTARFQDLIINHHSDIDSDVTLWEG